MSDTEKAAYIDAELCLMSQPPQLFDFAQNRWDELVYGHVINSNVIHNVGGFLPWHRLYMRVHEKLLQDECGYTGAQPYWEEALDVDDLASSVVFDPDTGFGGFGNGSCVTDGPFTQLELHITQYTNYGNYCLTRSMGENIFQGATLSSISECLNTTTYDDAYDCFQQDPHTAGHGGVGGTMLDVVASPSDPLFFLHHTNLDRLWWQWQSQNLSARLTDMGGQNVPTDKYLAQNNFTYPSAAFLDYDGDAGNVTTLNHTLWMVGLIPNATVSEVMDLSGDLICAEYV
ncbi:Di-copper centre-containing protein [Massarina eburnea CBS 473.64]|uniref:Di-copper centre-containing protein n=1 Tax=Massarina eburnea CBS 473.64 TaxID=1395130 RepID=A0A6A6SDH1_9PLEO|nr:Di-copper centre-containing protein [Massarina eburnea CBS 473.64]